jgi:class 3 adenylate cyclase
VRAASPEEAAWWEPSGAIEVRGLDAPVEVSRPR